VTTILREWMEQHYPALLAVIDWPRYRLLGRCWAQDCPVATRLNVLHPPRQLRRCESTPMAIGLTLRGWLLAKGMDPAVLDAWCEAYGLDPGAVVQPVVPANVA
jgi:hypothetical protein